MMFFIVGLIIIGFIAITTLIIVTINSINNNENYDSHDHNLNKNNTVQNHEEINKDYIIQKYGYSLLYALMGQRDKESDIYSFYINKNDANDIKLPYEFLSPIKTLELNYDNHNLLFKLDINNNYEHLLIHYNNDDDYSYGRYNNLILGKCYSNYGNEIRWSHDKAYKNFNLLYRNGDIAYSFTRYHQINRDSLSNHFKSGKALIRLIDKYNLNSESIIQYYISLIKQKQPSIDELINVLIKFEKSKQEIHHLNILKQNETINNMLENNKYNHTNHLKYDNIVVISTI